MFTSCYQQDVVAVLEEPPTDNASHRSSSEHDKTHTAEPSTLAGGYAMVQVGLSHCRLRLEMRIEAPKWATFLFMIGVKVAERLNGTRSHPDGNGPAPPAEEHRPPGQRADAASNVAAVVQPLLDVYFAGGPPVRFSFWDGSTAGPESTPGCVVVHSPTALTRMLWSPNELGMARAFVAGDIDIDGDFYGVLKALRRNATVTAKAQPTRSNERLQRRHCAWAPLARRRNAPTKRCAFRAGVIPNSVTPPPSGTTTT